MTAKHIRGEQRGTRRWLDLKLILLLAWLIYVPRGMVLASPFSSAPNQHHYVVGDDSDDIDWEQQFMDAPEEADWDFDPPGLPAPQAANQMHWPLCPLSVMLCKIHLQAIVRARLACILGQGRRYRPYMATYHSWWSDRRPALSSSAPASLDQVGQSWEQYIFDYVQTLL
jgi:hypothetical protein